MNTSTLECHAGAFKDFVLHVDLQSALVDDERQETGEISGVKLAGMEGNGGGHIQRPQDGNAAVYNLLAPLSERTVATGTRGQINYNRTRLHILDCLLGKHKRSPPPPELCGGKDY